MPIMIVLRWVIYLAVVLWFLIYWRGGVQAVEDIRNATSSYDRSLMTVIAACTALMLVVSFLVLLDVLALAEMVQKILLTWLGSGLVVLGIVGKYISRRTLEKYWTAETTLQDAHQVVDQGPYGRIRHPIYISAMMMYLGWLMVFPIWLNGVGAVLVIAAYTLKTKDEDEYLQEHLSGYQEYSKEVLYRLIPRIW